MNARLTYLLVAVLLILGLGESLPRVQAVIINVPITNYSFEEPALDSGYTRNSTDPTPGWNWTGGDSGVSKIGAAAPDGVQVGWFLHGISLWQKTPALLTDGLGYQLDVEGAQDSAAQPIDITYALYSGNDLATGTLLASGTTTINTAGADAFQPLTVTFDPSTPGYAALVAAHTGENIIVAFTGSNSVASADIDVVQMFITPEPASLGLMAFGSLLMLRRRRA